MNKVLLIVENETSFACNSFFDETIIQKRINEKDYDFLFEIVFSNVNCKKILAFRRIDFKEDNRLDQRFFCSNDYKEHFGNFDFLDMFLDAYKSIDVDFCGYICGGDAESVELLESITKKKLVLLDPYGLFDRDIYFKR